MKKIFLSVSSIQAFFSEALKIPKVVSVDLVFGSADLMVVVEVQTTEELSSAAAAIQNLTGASSTRTNVAYPVTLQRSVKSIGRRTSR